MYDGGNIGSFIGLDNTTSDSLLTYVLYDKLYSIQYITDVYIFSTRLQLPAVLQKNPPALAHSLVFQHLCIFEPSDCMILRSIFSHEGQLVDSYMTITKGENIYWCSRRQHNASRAGGCKLLEVDDQGKSY